MKSNANTHVHIIFAILLNVVLSHCSGSSGGNDSNKYTDEVVGLIDAVDSKSSDAVDRICNCEISTHPSNDYDECRNRWYRDDLLSPADEVFIECASSVIDSEEELEAFSEIMGRPIDDFGCFEDSGDLCMTLNEGCRSNLEVTFLFAVDWCTSDSVCAVTFIDIDDCMIER